MVDRERWCGEEAGTDVDADVVHEGKMMQGDTHLAYHSCF